VICSLLSHPLLVSEDESIDELVLYPILIYCDYLTIVTYTFVNFTQIYK